LPRLVRRDENRDTLTRLARFLSQGVSVKGRAVEPHHPLTVDDRLSLAEAARLIVERCYPTEDKRLATDKARKRITRARDSGTLNCIKGTFRLGDFAYWARRQGGWCGKFDDLPASTSPVLITDGGTQRRQGGSGTLSVIPESAADRAALIIKQQAEINALRAENKALRDENETLRAAEEQRKTINIKKGKRTNKM
jgi:hypothetical protein